MWPERLCQTKTRQKPPFLLKQRSSVWYITTTISLGIFTDSFTYAIVVPILPYTLPSRTGIEGTQTQLWATVMVAFYGGALLLASPIVGFIADRTKTRCRSYIFSLLMLFSAALVLCLGRNVIAFVFARALQGFSAALVWTAGLALLSDSVPGKNIGQAMGFAAFASSNAMLLGLLLGGIIYERLGYQRYVNDLIAASLGLTWCSIFYMCFFLMLIDMVMRVALIEKKAAKKWLTADETTLDPESEAYARETCDQPAVSQKARGKACATLPSLPSVRLMCALFSTFVSAILIASFEAIIPLHIKTVFGWSSSQTGILFAALVVPSFLSSLVGSLSDRLGVRWIVCTGYTLFCPLLIGLCFVRVDTVAGIFLFCMLLAGLGTCYSIVNVPILGEYKNIVAEKGAAVLMTSKNNNAYAQAYGMYNMAYATGILVGPIANGFIAQKAGFEVMMGVLALICAVTAMITAIWSGPRLGSRLETHLHSESAEQRAIEIMQV